MTAKTEMPNEVHDALNHVLRALHEDLGQL